MVNVLFIIYWRAQLAGIARYKSNHIEFFTWSLKKATYMLCPFKHPQINILHREAPRLRKWDVIPLFHTYLPHPPPNTSGFQLIATHLIFYFFLKFSGNREWSFWDLGAVSRNWHNNQQAWKAVVVYIQDTRGFNSCLDKITKPSVNTPKWTGLLSRTCALILLDFGWNTVAFRK